MEETKNILKDMKKIIDFISFYRDGFKNIDPLNQRNINVAFNFANVFCEIADEYIKNKVDFPLSNARDLFTILVVNGIQDDIYKIDFELPLGCDKLILKSDTILKLKILMDLFVPQNKRELKLIKQLNSLSVKSEMDDIYEASSINILNKENGNNYNVIDDIYIYNSHYNSHAINDFSIFISFINAYKQNKLPVFDSCVNPDSNKQFIFINNYSNQQNMQ